MSTINNANSNLNTIDAKIATEQKAKETGVQSILVKIDKKMAELTLSGMKNRKAKKATKESILNGIDGETNKGVLRAYSLAFTAHFRNIYLTKSALELPMPMLENMVNYATVASCDALFENTDYDEIKAHLKSLKTRPVTSMTFEKKTK